MGCDLASSHSLRFLGMSILLLIHILGLACSKSSTQSNTSSTSTTSSSSYTSDQLLNAFRSVSLRTTLALPKTEDVDALLAATDAKTAYDNFVDSYVGGEGLRATLTDYFRVIFGMGGDPDDPSQDDPSRLAVYIVMNDLSYTELVTANYKIDTNGLQVVGQDSGAPLFAVAGFLTLKSWLQAYAGNNFLFNYVRETARVASCFHYPDPDTSFFSWDESNIATKYLATADINCHECHKTMNVRRSVWYKFDQNGSYRDTPSSGNMYGHEPPPGTGGSEVSEPLQGAGFKYTDVITTPATLGQQIAASDRFGRCAARRFLAFSLGYDTGSAGQNGRLPFDFDSSSREGDKQLLDTWTVKLQSDHSMKIRSFLKAFFKSDDFISRVNFL